MGAVDVPELNGFTPAPLNGFVEADGVLNGFVGAPKALVDGVLFAVKGFVEELPGVLTPKELELAPNPDPKLLAAVPNLNA